jgi:hypothetical protein
MRQWFAVSFGWRYASTSVIRRTTSSLAQLLAQQLSRDHQRVAGVKTLRQDRRHDRRHIPV